MTQFMWRIAGAFGLDAQTYEEVEAWRALAVCAAGWLVSFVFVAIIGIAFAPPVF